MYKAYIKHLPYECQTESQINENIMHFYFPGDDFMDTLSDDEFYKAVFERKWSVDKNGTFEITGTPLDDAFRITKYLLNNLRVDLKITPARELFVIMSNQPERAFQEEKKSGRVLDDHHGYQDLQISYLG